MDFAMSKENIQPLRGGRNVAQLEVGLQAQHNPQYQEQLMLQKQQYENAIRNYTGDDPLDAYYQYIYWVEQSFPKHGHEGNFVNLLEDCLGRFENDRNYQNDIRYCKLWIKYIDLQSNHTELYQLLYAKRIGVGCADLYKAWAYYFEAAGDVKRADQVYRLGKAELAQPFQELEWAHHNFVYTCGCRMLNNGATDARRLADQRQALTTLQTFKSGQVGNMRVPSSASGAGVLPMSQAGFNNENRAQNAPIVVHEEYPDILFGGGVAPVSILGVVKRTAPNENVMEAGVWTGAVKKSHTIQKTSSIPVHMDTPLPPHELGIQLPATFVSQTREDFSQWKNVPLCIPDPENPNQIPMYPKAQCYGDPITEFSIEEIMARRYRLKANKRDVRMLDSLVTMDTDAMNRSSTSMDCADTSLPQQIENYAEPHQQLNLQPVISSPSPTLRVSPYASPPRQMHPQHQVSQQYNQYNQLVHNSPMQHPQQQHHQNNMYQGHHQPQQQHSMQHMHHSMTQQQLSQTPQAHYSANNSPALSHYRNTPQNVHNSPHGLRLANPYRHSMPPYDQPSIPNQSIGQHMSPHPHNSIPTIQHYSPLMHQQQQSPHVPAHSMPSMLSPHHSYQQMLQPPPLSMIENSQYNEPKTYANLTLQSPQVHASYQHTNLMHTLGETHHDQQQRDSISPAAVSPASLWTSPMEPARPSALDYYYADSPQPSGRFQPQIEPKGNAMKTIKVLSDDELAETGSRGGLDVAAVAQPTDGAKRLFENDENDDNIAANTEVFNLHAMHVSTPANKMNNENPIPHLDVGSTKKKLFCGLSDIKEESSFQSSTSGSTSTLSGTGPRSIFASSRPGAMEPISEGSNYHLNLSENMKANAELRSKLYGSESPVSRPPTTTNFEIYESFNQQDEKYNPQQVNVDTSDDDEVQQHVPYPVLNMQPADPFTNSVLEAFLAHVKFPGRHRHSVIRIDRVPKLAIKKDACYVGNDRYLVEKSLGKGTYGSVYKATNQATGAIVALKIQKPPNKWEFYICKEIQARLADHPLRDRFMNVHVGYFGDLSSVLVSDVHSGSLLDLMNSIKPVSPSCTNAQKHNLWIHFTGEMMRIVQALHQIQIIHADIKPDNFLVMIEHDSLRLQLIDFGCSIDMSLMPEGTAFMRKVKTDSFQCCEMKDGRPWNYHTDLFCIAATSHVLLFGDYIELKNLNGRWSIAKKIPRYYRDDLWSMFFNHLLNMQEGLADLDYLITTFDDALDPRELRSATTHIINSFKNR